MAKVVATRGRPAIAATGADKAKILIAVRDMDVMNIPSRPVVMQLVESGHLVGVPQDRNGRRGRPVIKYELTGKARSLIALVNRNTAKLAAQA